jgi:hypothetical protein
MTGTNSLHHQRSATEAPETNSGVKTHGKIFRYNIKLNHQNWDHCNENAEMTNKDLGQSLPLDPSVVELAIAKNIGYSRDILVVELGK